MTQFRSEMMKACTKCGETKVIRDFYTYARNGARCPTGACRECIKRQVKITVRRWSRIITAEELAMADSHRRQEPHDHQ